MARRLALLMTMLSPLALVLACGESAQRKEMTNLRLLSVYYSQFRAQNRGQPPASEQEFKKFISGYGPEALSQAGIDTVDQLFVSTRDGKPFVVKYRGAKSWPLPEAVAYEQAGQDGTRYIATPVGGYDEVSDEEFRRAHVASRPAK